MRWVLSHFVGALACRGLLKLGAFPCPSNRELPSGQDCVSPLALEAPEGRVSLRLVEPISKLGVLMVRGGSSDQMSLPTPDEIYGHSGFRLRAL